MALQVLFGPNVAGAAPIGFTHGHVPAPSGDTAKTSRNAFADVGSAQLA